MQSLKIKNFSLTIKYNSYKFIHLKTRSNIKIYLIIRKKQQIKKKIMSILMKIQVKTSLLHRC